MKLGVLFRMEKEYTKALVHFKKALKINPNLMDVFINFISTYMEMKEYDTALEKCDTQLEITPGNPVAHGLIYNLKGEIFLLKK